MVRRGSPRIELQVRPRRRGEALLVLAAWQERQCRTRLPPRCPAADRRRAGVPAVSSHAVPAGSSSAIPLMQSAIYAASLPAQRRNAHQALAAGPKAVRRAWHLAGAAERPDESVAETLEAAAAGGARIAGGLAAEAQALDGGRADAGRRATAVRLLAAAQNWRRAGRIEHARRAPRPGSVVRDDADQGSHPAGARQHASFAKARSTARLSSTVLGRGRAGRGRPRRSWRRRCSSRQRSALDVKPEHAARNCARRASPASSPEAERDAPGAEGGERAADSSRTSAPDLRTSWILSLV